MNTKKQKTILFLAASLLCVAIKSSEAKDSGRHVGKPNVLSIAIDDLNDWTDMLKGNSQARTPHMDRLAAQGMTFMNAHCAAPACGPSRAAIMSGISPATSGNYVNRGSILHNPILNNSVLMPEFFQQNEYHVLGTGKLFHGAHFQQGCPSSSGITIEPPNISPLFVRVNCNDGVRCPGGRPTQRRVHSRR